MPETPISMQSKVKYGIRRHECECHGYSLGMFSSLLACKRELCGTGSGCCPSRADTLLVDMGEFCSRMRNKRLDLKCLGV